MTAYIIGDRVHNHQYGTGTIATYPVPDPAIDSGLLYVRFDKPIYADIGGIVDACWMSPDKLSLLADTNDASTITISHDRFIRMVHALSSIDTALSHGGFEGVSKYGIEPGDLDID